MYNLEPIFPTFLHHLKIDITKELIDFCYNIRDRDPEGVKKTNIGGWQSQGFPPNNTIGHNLIENVLSQTSQVFTEIPKLTNWWININTSDSYNRMHVHPGSHISGVIWIKIPEQSGNLYFPNSNYFSQAMEIDAYKSFVNQGYGHQVIPQDGGVILFPSFLQHEVFRNFSNDERISISFNSSFPTTSVHPIRDA